MKIEKNTIVSLRYKLSDAQNNIIEEPDTVMVYLHGGYAGTFPKIESLLDGHRVSSRFLGRYLRTRHEGIPSRYRVLR